MDRMPPVNGLSKDKSFRHLLQLLSHLVEDRPWAIFALIKKLPQPRGKKWKNTQHTLEIHDIHYYQGKVSLSSQGTIKHSCS